MVFSHVFKLFKVGFKPTAGLARHIHFACTDINQLFTQFRGNKISFIYKKEKKKKTPERRSLKLKNKLENAITCTIPVYLSDEMYSDNCPSVINALATQYCGEKSWPNAVKLADSCICPNFVLFFFSHGIYT